MTNITPVATLHVAEGTTRVEWTEGPPPEGLTLSMAVFAMPPANHVFVAYRVSTRHYYDGERSETFEHLIDADTSAHVLTQRVNAHYAKDEMIRQERGNKMMIPAFAMQSNTVHGSGGGCDYDAHLEIRVAPRLKGTT